MNKNERLKPQYILSRQDTQRFSRIQFGMFSARRNHYMRRFSCRQELSMAVMHSIEYGSASQYQIRIRAKRKHRLPDPWDDYFAEDLTYKNWKDRTKRRKQHYK